MVTIVLKNISIRFKDYEKKNLILISLLQKKKKKRKQEKNTEHISARKEYCINLLVAFMDECSTSFQEHLIK